MNRQNAIKVNSKGMLIFYRVVIGVSFLIIAYNLDKFIDFP